ncbi:MAG: helix-hairpin-helix domain-containing protein [Clostridia bacterium]|nr:helix-hairpin-helix domain-containing protein [Clostridia bacterium]
MENIKKNKVLYVSICGIIIVICLIICYVIDKNSGDKSYSYTQLMEDNYIENTNNINTNTEDFEEEKIIYIHITGEVVNPGVVSISEGSRIKDVIEKAGGVTSEADVEKVNLAYQVSDGQKINIPNINDKNNNIENYITETEGENIIISDKNSKANEKVNINTATQTELETLTGIGPSIAAKIIEYRKTNGKFKTIEDIKNVSGIGDGKYRKIENEIVAK